MTTAGCVRDADANCFSPDADLPRREATLADPKLGQSGRELATALFDRDLDRADTLLSADPALAHAKVGKDHDMLTVALATCELRAVDLLLRHGAPRNGNGIGTPLVIALMAREPDLAHALLSAGASPTPPKNPLGPFTIAIASGSMGGVRMLLDFRADVNAMDELGNRPLHTALDMERFLIAELLLDRGADPWAIDSGGANLGSSVQEVMITNKPDEAAAQQRLQQRLARIGWPSPPPSPEQVRRLALDGQWPPAGIKAPRVPEFVLRIMAKNARGATTH